MSPGRLKCRASPEASVDVAGQALDVGKTSKNH